MSGPVLWGEEGASLAMSGPVLWGEEGASLAMSGPVLWGEEGAALAMSRPALWARAGAAGRAAAAEEGSARMSSTAVRIRPELRLWAG
jgi:hypothetical protein